ncbi:MAG: endopeptidase La [Acidobacteriota bacterium]|nr:endopeptidase La [Blastocatellia bacterium]MDW8412253.1 endopeptidase La [Acidobacteriota bacterium]
MQEFHDSTPDDVAKYPMVPIRDVVVFPYTLVRFKIGRQPSVLALQKALLGDRIIFLATQHDATLEEPTPEQVYKVGTLARIAHHLYLADGNIKVQVEGVERARAVRIEDSERYWQATVRRFVQPVERSSRINALVGRLTSLVDQYVRQAPEGVDALHSDLQIEDPSRLADAIASHLKISVEEKQAILEAFPLHERLLKLIEIVEIELDKLQIDRIIQNRVKKQMEKAQREYYLNEKIKAINKELGRKDEKAELDELKKKIEASGMTQDAYNKAMSELRRLEQMPPMSAESAVSRNYLEWLLAVPWKEASPEVRDMKYAEEVLEADHYGLEKVKERILEFLAVRQLVENPKGSILCFVGPPGVGKTSLGRSIARATGRKFVRLSLGGVRDEAEIRGHRRTYIGALPGQIIQMMKKAGTINPLMLLDEIDKLGMDFRGDPAAALLEVLDPEQNNTFQDHYLDVEYDLSKVMFIATANVLHTIPPALQDRLEIIRLSGYTEREKVEIARRYLVPKQLEMAGIKNANVVFTEDAITTIIQNYTREAGVRNLEREISSVCRKIARKYVLLSEAERGNFSEVVDGEKVKSLLGPIRYRSQIANEKSEVGIATGLAWTEVGGEVLQVETTLMPGRGALTLTGKLGEVMQESMRAAMSCVRARAKRLGIPNNFYKKYDIHIHVPEGAIPKDGPSAGITIATAIVSLLTDTPVRKEVAMTGEITLRGRVLAIGGVKEKLLAAHRAGIKVVVLPKANEKDLVEVPQEVLNTFEIHLVDSLDEVLQIALEETSSDKVQQERIVPVWDSKSPEDVPRVESCHRTLGHAR